MPATVIDLQLVDTMTLEHIDPLRWPLTLADGLLVCTQHRDWDGFALMEIRYDAAVPEWTSATTRLIVDPATDPDWDQEASTGQVWWFPEDNAFVVVVTLDGENFNPRPRVIWANRCTYSGTTLTVGTTVKYVNDNGPNGSRIINAVAIDSYTLIAAENNESGGTRVFSMDTTTGATLGEASNFTAQFYDPTFFVSDSERLTLYRGDGVAFFVTEILRSGTDYTYWGTAGAGSLTVIGSAPETSRPAWHGHIGGITLDGTQGEYASWEVDDSVHYPWYVTGNSAPVGYDLPFDLPPAELLVSPEVGRYAQSFGNGSTFEAGFDTGAVVLRREIDAYSGANPGAWRWTFGIDEVHHRVTPYPKLWLSQDLATLNLLVNPEYRPAGGWVLDALGRR